MCYRLPYSIGGFEGGTEWSRRCGRRQRQLLETGLDDVDVGGVRGHVELLRGGIRKLDGLLKPSARFDRILLSGVFHQFCPIYTGGMLCVYGSECLAFIRFQRGSVPAQPALNVRLTPPRMRRYERLINRDGEYYMRHHYRAHWQPMWAVIGLVSCTLLMAFSGWSAIYDLCKVRLVDGIEVSVVDEGGSAFALVAAYSGVILTLPSSWSFGLRLLISSPAFNFLLYLSQLQAAQRHEDQAVFRS
jgi:hypothetical protein